MTTCRCQTLFNNNKDDYEPSYCYSCVQTILRDKIVSYKETLFKRNEAKQDCASHLLDDDCNKESSSSSKIQNYQTHIKHQADKLSALREECASKTIILASLSLQNSNRTVAIEQQQERIYQLQHQLYMLRNCILYEDTSSLTGVIDRHVNVIKEKRFQLALHAFQMHRLDVGEEYSRLSMKELLRLAELDEVTSNEENSRFKRLVKEKVPSGIGSIFGLCMPHRGPSDFYGIIPHDVLISSLRYISSLTNILARCLGIDLPHPIVLNATSSQSKQSFLQDTADIVQSVPSNQVLDASSRGNHMTLMADLDLLTSGTPKDTKLIALDATTKSTLATLHIPSENGKVTSSSNASLMSLVGSSSNLISRAAHRAFDKMKGSNHDTMHHGQYHYHDKNVRDRNEVLRKDKSSLKTKLQNASYAVIYESNNLENSQMNPVKYELKPPLNGLEDESYTTGLQLLQNDIVALVIRAGVPVAMLWPAEAMLLNLQSLYLFCQCQLSEE